jgi:hypothetical protein
MKLSEKTIAVLKEFSSINPAILISAGNEIKTISPTKTIIAKTTVDDTFPKDIALHNLSKFLGVVSLMNNPDFIFADDHIKVTDESNYEVRMTYAALDTIVVAPKKDLVLPSVDSEFTLKADIVNKIHRAASVLQVPEIVITGRSGRVIVSAEDVANKASDTFKLDIGTCDSDFKVIIKVENLKIIPLDYEVMATSKGLAHFVNAEREYWIATEVRKS